MIVEEIQGNLLDTSVGVIAHGVNCQNEMGSGVARALFVKWPNVKTFYHRFVEQNSWEDNRGLLGDYHEVRVGNLLNKKIIVNCFTQLYYGYDGKKYVSYDAIFDCFKELSTIYDEIAIPKIGCGLAGGNWEIVKQIINDATEDRCKVHVYYLGE